MKRSGVGKIDRRYIVDISVKVDLLFLIESYRGYIIDRKG